MKRKGWIVAGFVAVAALAGLLTWRGGSPVEHTDRSPGPAFVGGQICAQCHQDQFEQWKGSHHDLAMQPASAQSVLGDFQNATFSDGGITTTFLRVGDRFLVRTEGPDGKTRDYPVAYTFGVDPLQQYLVELDGGRMQALTIAWDTHNRRWFSLYPGRNIAPDDWLHWTNRGQNWNSNCAECHSTNLRKNYDPVKDTYRTTWSEINVSCEACHGPGSEHIAWARSSPLGRWWGGYDERTRGLTVRLRDPHRAWGFDAQGSPTLLGNSDRNPDVQVGACALCHARRGPISDAYEHGQPFHDHFVPQVLQENIYHPDGQILDEVYEYGSFVQSRMHHKGVRCSDCHNPHSLKLIAPGNALCIRCHNGSKYDTPSHHFHGSGSPGATCVECHMPSRTYMVVDPRRDHSLRIPRPDLTVKLGVPNACNDCHKDRDASWAAAAVEAWYGDKARDDHYGSVFAAAWEGNRHAGEGLRKLLLNEDQSSWVRASAAASLQGFASEASLAAAKSALSDPSPLVRTMSAAHIAMFPPEQRTEILAPLLDDPSRAVRQVAARSLLSIPRKDLAEAQAQRLDEVIREQTESMLAHSDSLGGRMALGGLYQDLGQHDKALAAYQAAAAMDPQNIDATMALVELLIRLSRDQEAEPLLRRLLDLSKPPELTQRMWNRARGTVQYQLGLLLASNPARLAEGVRHLTEARQLIPESTGLHLNLGRALIHMNRDGEGEAALKTALELSPDDPDVLLALAMFHRDRGRLSAALDFARRIAALIPHDPQLQAFVQQLEGAIAQPGRPVVPMQ